MPYFLRIKLMLFFLLSLFAQYACGSHAADSCTTITDKINSCPTLQSSIGTGIDIKSTCTSLISYSACKDFINSLANCLSKNTCSNVISNCSNTIGSNSNYISCAASDPTDITTISNALNNSTSDPNGLSGILGALAH